MKAQVAAESDIAYAVRANSNFANAVAQEDIPDLIDVKGLARPKEFSSKEEDFQQWPKKTDVSSLE